MNIEETRNGILKYLENNGSNATMYILHGYSKLIHQVAHREFSEAVSYTHLTLPTNREV